MFCANCGSDVPAGSGFCPKCGQIITLSSANVSQNIGETLIQPGIPQNSIDGVGHQTNDLQPNNDSQPNNTSGMRKSNLIIICTAVALVVMFVVGLVLYIISAKKIDKKIYETQIAPYENKSAEAKDQRILCGWVTAALSAYSANAAVCTGSSYEIEILFDKGFTSSCYISGGSGSDRLLESFMLLSGLDNSISFSSKLYRSITGVTLLITPYDSYVVSISDISFESDSSENRISTTELIAK